MIKEEEEASRKRLTEGSKIFNKPDSEVNESTSPSPEIFKAPPEHEGPGHVTTVMQLLEVGHVIPSVGLLGNNLKDFWGYNSAC